MNVDMSMRQHGSRDVQAKIGQSEVFPYTPPPNLPKPVGPAEVTLPDVTSYLGPDGHVALDSDGQLKSALGGAAIAEEMNNHLDKLGMSRAAIGDLPWTL